MHGRMSWLLEVLGSKQAALLTKGGVLTKLADHIAPLVGCSQA